MNAIPQANDRIRAVNFAPAAVDDNQTVQWDNGSMISLLINVDKWEIVR